MAAVTIKGLSGIKQATSSLSEDLAARIRDDILSGKLPDGSKLTEQTVCDKYKVSRTPVREALSKLEVEGLIENIPNRGAFIRGLSQQDISDIMTMRKIYEIQAVRWAVERITDDELDELEENFEFMEFYTMKNDIDKMLNINRSFHQMIYRASHNRMLAQLLYSYQNYIRHDASSLSRTEDYLQTVLSEHRQIFLAIRSRDQEAAVAAMESHMDNSIRRHAVK
jgi:DNA-binding GntR family transcriptional regulator